MEFSEKTDINKLTIKLVYGKLLFYGPIYALSLVELETLKIYIKTYLKTGFIWPSKSLIGTSILFDKNLDKSLYLYINYQGFNNLIIKNRYPLLLISKSLDWLGQVKRFTQLNFINAYHWIRIWEDINKKLYSKSGMVILNTIS